MESSLFSRKIGFDLEAALSKLDVLLESSTHLGATNAVDL
jgi:hypothetical protein